MDSLTVTDAAAAAVAVAPRITLADIEAAILARYELTGADAVCSLGVAIAEPLTRVSICVVVMRNGFTIIGKSAAASPENFNADLGRRLAYEDAVRQLWPLMGFSLRDRLAAV